MGATVYAQFRAPVSADAGIARILLLPLADVGVDRFVLLPNVATPDHKRGTFEAPTGRGG